jgi:hypothetical protein
VDASRLKKENSTLFFVLLQKNSRFITSAGGSLINRLFFAREEKIRWKNGFFSTMFFAQKNSEK